MRKAAVQALLDQTKRLVEAQALVIDDITTAQAASTAYRGNKYRSYKSAVLELARKYEGVADWGVLQTGNILDVRAAFIIGEGINVYPVSENEEGAKDELTFVKDFIEFNDLDGEMVQEFAKEAEIEGRFLGQLFWDEKAEMVSVRWRSWTTSKYTVKTDPNDYSKFLSATWFNPGGASTTINEPDFVYARFGGRLNQPNSPYPKVAKCLGQIEGLDKALRDWEEITRLYAAPIPHIECETKEQAAYMADAIEAVAKNFKIKKLFAHTGKLDYASPDTTGMQYLENLILTLAKMISGTTGCPVGLMGLGDLTTKLGSSSEITADQLTATTSKEREIWIGTYSEMLSKAMVIKNKLGKTQLDPDKIEVSIPLITNETWKRIADVWMPLRLSNSLSLKTFLSKIPRINVRDEMKAIEKESEIRIKNARDAFGGDEGDEGDNDEE